MYAPAACGFYPDSHADVQLLRQRRQRAKERVWQGTIEIGKPPFKVPTAAQTSAKVEVEIQPTRFL